MAREKATITIDRERARDAMALTGATTVSGVVDLALQLLVQRERLRQDIEAYRRSPQTDAERALSDIPVALDLGDDDVDYDILYGPTS